MNLVELQEVMREREAWLASVHGVTKNWTRFGDWKTTFLHEASQVALVVKNLPVNAQDAGLIPESGRCWRRKWQLTLVVLPGKSHGQRILMNYVHRITNVGHDLVTKPQPFSSYQVIFLADIFANYIKFCLISNKTRYNSSITLNSNDSKDMFILIKAANLS